MAGPAYNNLGTDVEMLLKEEEQEEEARMSPPTKPRAALVLSALFVASALAVFGWKGFRPALTSSLGGTVGFDEEEVQCFDGGAEKLEMTLPAFDDKSITADVIPQEIEKYAYATESALVAIPDACYTEFKDKIKDHTTLTDRGADSDTAYFFLKDLEGGVETLAKMKDCACGLLIEMHGSGGPGWSAAQFAAIFSHAGYIAILPNSMAQPDEMGLKSKLPEKKASDIDTSDWCGGFNAFEGSCSKFSKPYCYSSKLENIVEDSDSYRKYVEGVYKIRKLEMDYFVENAKPVLDAFDTVFLAGNSEGAMAAARYHHKALDKKLAGRILSAWSCNFNYFVSCPKHAEVCGDKCDKDVPQLNLIGQQDEYFGREDSMSSKVAADEKGYGGPITGNCRAAYDDQGFTKATVVEFEEAGHGPQYWNDNTWRNVIGDFIQNAGADDDSWKSLEGCTKEDGVHVCPLDGTTTCLPGWTLNSDATFHEVTPVACPPIRRRLPPLEKEKQSGGEDGPDE